MNINSRKALTLVEIMLSVAIMATAVIPIFGLLSYSDRGTREQDAEGIAANLAKEEMNWLMNVVTIDNLLDAVGSPQTWKLGATNIKGNIFTGTYQVFKTDNTNLKFKIPQMKFHDPRKCPTGKEIQSGILKAPIEVLLSDVLPPGPGIPKVMIVDILLKVKWRMPYEHTFDARKSFTLVARRSFLVKN